MIDTLAVVALIVAALALVLHLLPRKPQSDPAALQKAEKIDDEVWTWIADHLKGHAAPNAPAALPAPNVTHTVTFGGSPPAGTSGVGTAGATGPASSGKNTVAITTGVVDPANGMIPTKNADGTIRWTAPVPKGDVTAADGSLLQPVTAADLFAAFMKVSAAQGGYWNNFGTENQMAWLRSLTPSALADWCASALAVPGVGGGTNGYGWLTGLSLAGQGFFTGLGQQTPSINIPNTDPRA